MSRYILRRLLLNVLVIWIVASLVFVAVHALPGDFAVTQGASNLELADNTAALTAARHLLGTDRPLWRQYVSFMGELAHGNLGRSYATRRIT
ncbi:MAG: hypothetical protein ACR2PL_00430 [Dehalococcoidia bacterium]